MWYPDDVQHLGSLSGLVGRWVARRTGARSRPVVTATAQRATARR
jgi:hypothetical protein